ncbi:unnamed protein product, partial [Prorocentrum cordatum]
MTSLAAGSCVTSPVMTPREVRAPPLYSPRQHRPSFLGSSQFVAVERMTSGPPVLSGVSQSTAARVTYAQILTRAQEQPPERDPDAGHGPPLSQSSRACPGAQPRSAVASPRQTFRYVQHPGARQPVPLLNLAPLSSSHQGSPGGVPTVARTARGATGEGMTTTTLSPHSPARAQAPLTAREPGVYAARVPGAVPGSYVYPAHYSTGQA